MDGAPGGDIDNAKPVPVSSYKLNCLYFEKLTAKLNTVFHADRAVGYFGCGY